VDLCVPLITIFLGFVYYTFEIISSSIFCLLIDIGDCLTLLPYFTTDNSCMVLYVMM